MKIIKCDNCGSSDFKEIDGFYVCSHCGTKYKKTIDDYEPSAATIDFNSDVQKLLDQWDKFPGQADKYAHLILEIDPTNQRALDQIRKPVVTSSNQGCYIATAVYESYDCPQVWTLRRFRDYTLNTTFYGRVFIKTYYLISPTIVKCFGKKKWFKEIIKPNLDRFVAKLNEGGVENTPYIDKY